MKKALYIIIPLLFIASTAIGAALYITTPSKKFSPFEAGTDKLIVYNGMTIDSQVLIIDNDMLYLPYSFVVQYIEDDVFIDREYGLISVFFDAELYTTDADEDLYIFEDNEYIRFLYLSDIFPLEIIDAGQFVMIFDDRKSYDYVNVLEQGYIRHEDSIKSPYMELMQADDTLFLISEKGDWYEVLSFNGNIGYIQKKELSQTKIWEAVYIETLRTDLSLFGRDSFGWQMMYSIPDDPESLDIHDGIDVISPTWISLVNKTGQITHRISSEYTNRLKQAGILVMPCVTNAFDDPGMTSDFLNDPNARKTFINSLLELCDEYGFDGINIDFENIRFDNKNHLTQFIRELSYYFGQKELFLTVCTGVTGGSFNYSLVYDHKKIGQFADYVMVMSYDELPYTGREYGPVASMIWQERKLLELIELVPPEKVYMGIPLYTRVWNMNNEDSYSSIPISFIRQEEIIEENETGVFDIDERNGQKTFGYYKNETDYLMYIEDEFIMEQRWALIKRLGLAGGAYWAVNYVRADYFSNLRP